MKLHERLQWKIDFISKAELKTKDDLSLAYSPGVAELREIAKDPENAYKYTIKANTVAVISQIEAQFYDLEIFDDWQTSCYGGKMCTFKAFAWVNAFFQ